MAYLENFDPPELPSGASMLRKQLELRVVFHALQIPPSPNTVRLLTMYLITTDKSAREYTSGCARVRDHMTASDGLQALVEGLGHFENCVNAAKRALRALGRLGTQREGLSIDRTIRKLAQSRAKIITDLRDAVEHMDADVVSDIGIPEGAPHLLSIDKTGVNLEIGAHHLSIVSLHSVVCSLHNAGLEIIQALPSSTDA